MHIMTSPHVPKDSYYVMRFDLDGMSVKDLGSGVILVSEQNEKLPPGVLKCYREKPTILTGVNGMEGSSSA